MILTLTALTFRASERSKAATIDRLGGWVGVGVGGLNLSAESKQNNPYEKEKEKAQERVYLDDLIKENQQENTNHGKDPSVANHSIKSK